MIDESPALPELRADVICVAPVGETWLRVQIVSHDTDSEMCLVKYLDYGGYDNILGTDLKQIRTDFMTVSFQAIECLLSNIKPTGEKFNFLFCFLNCLSFKPTNNNFNY